MNFMNYCELLWITLIYCALLQLLWINRNYFDLLGFLIIDFSTGVSWFFCRALLRLCFLQLKLFKLLWMPVNCCKLFWVALNKMMQIYEKYREKCKMFIKISKEKEKKMCFCGSNLHFIRARSWFDPPG
jgi:hypothetical protein